MAATGVSAFEVGSYFISTYYRVLKESPEAAHHFYSESSTLTLVDGEDTQTVNTIEGFFEVLTSLKVGGVEVTKLNCQDSINGGILLVVSGIMKSENFSGKRRFTQIFFLAPQVKGYFVLNDILQFNDEVLVNQHPVPDVPEIKVDSEIPASSPRLELQTDINYELEEETREYVNSLHIEEDNPADKYSLPEEEHHEEPPIETIVEETPFDEPAPPETVVNHKNYVEDSVSVPADEPVLDPPRVSYASILRAAKGQSSQPSQPAVRKNMPPSEQQQKLPAGYPQLNASASSFVPEAPNAAGSDETSVQEEAELTSVYVRSLPTSITNADLEKELKKFGKIKPNGVVIKNKKDVGVCFAFVEFEDMSGVHNAIRSSPIELLGRQVYIEERRAGNSSSRGGGVVGRGRGRASYQSNTSRGRGGVRNSGRGILDNSDYNRMRSNGY